MRLQKNQSIYIGWNHQVFFNEAPDLLNLIKKVGAVMGIARFCHKYELCKITVNYIVNKGNLIVIKIPDSVSH